MYTRARTHHMHPAVVVVVAVLATYGCSLHHVRLQAAKLLFDQIDEDRSGEIAFSELARHLKYWESSLPTPPATPPRPRVRAKVRKANKQAGMFGAALQGVTAHSGKEEVLEKLRSSLSAVQACSKWQ